MDVLSQYSASVLVLGLTGLLLFVQLIVADVTGIKQGHTPGTAVADDPNTFIFRANRAFANTNETLGILLLFIAFAVLSAGDPQLVNGFAMLYLAGRVGHMLFYYANIKLLRSIAFAVSTAALLGIFVSGILRWL